MVIRLGNNAETGKLYVGNDEVQRIYRGGQQVWPTALTPSGIQTVTATVERGNVPVAPEPVYIELDAQGFTLPAALHPSLTPELTDIYYKTVWKKDGVEITGTYNSPENLTTNEKGYIRGARFMWVCEESGTYTADVTAINMHDHSEVATTTIGPIVVENYVDWFTAQGDNAIFYILTADGDTTGVPQAVLDHQNVSIRTSGLNQASSDRRFSSNKFQCFLYKCGDTETANVVIGLNSGPNFYLRSYVGNTGTEKPKLRNGTGLTVTNDSNIIPNTSFIVTGIDYASPLDPTDINQSPASTEFLAWGSDAEAMICLHDCKAYGADNSITVLGNSINFQSRGVIWDCDIGSFIQSNVIGGFGKFTSFVGSKLMHDPDGFGTYQGIGAGWGIRHSDDGHHWMNETGTQAAWDATNHLQGSLRLGAANIEKEGGYVYVGGCTLLGAATFGTQGSFNETTTINATLEGCRIGAQSQRLGGVLSTILSGVRAFNNLTAYPSARPEQNLGTQFNGGRSYETKTAPSNDVWDPTTVDAGFNAQFNTHISVNDETGVGDNVAVSIDLNGTPIFTNVVDENNLTSAPYESLPRNIGAIDLSRFGTLTHTTKPYEAYDVPKANGSGVAEDMVSLTGTSLGFVAGETLTQGGVTAEIYVVQDDGIETRLWLANTTGGAFAAGAASSASGSGTLNGPAIYRGTMINGAPTTPVAADNKTWVPPIDHYGNPRSYATAVKGAVEPLG